MDGYDSYMANPDPYADADTDKVYAYDLDREIYRDEATPCCDEWFSRAEAANEYAVGVATAEELAAYVREDEGSFGAFISGNMDDCVYDHIGERAPAGDYITKLMRDYAAANSAFYDWLDAERAKPAAKKGAA